MLTIILSYSLAILLSFLALMPPIPFEVPLMVNSYAWVYGVLMCGAAAVYMLNAKMNAALRVLLLYVFANCFFSSAPFLSFNNFFVVVLAYMVFLLIQKCDERVIINAVIAIFVFQLLMVFMQTMQRDTLMNFVMDWKQFAQALNGEIVNQPLDAYTGTHQSVCFGTVFQPMRFGSYIGILAAFLFIYRKWFIVPAALLAIISQSSTLMVSLIAGLIIYALIDKKTSRFSKRLIVCALLAAGVVYASYDLSSWQLAFKDGRVANWIHIFKVGMQHPFIGWGMSTFAPLYRVLIKEVAPFCECHNCWLQIWWELGLIGITLVSIYGYSLTRRLLKKGKIEYVAGLAIIGTNMFVAFPTRMTQTALLIVAFIALCEKALKEKDYGHDPA